MVIFDVSINGFIAVFGFNCDLRSKIAFKVERNNFPFMGNGTGEVMNITTPWQELALLLNFLQYLL